MDSKNAIVLAMFGTSVESGLKGIMNVYDKTTKTYPFCKVMLSFTSAFLCNMWQKRSVNPSYLLDHGHVPEEILAIKGPLAVIAGLQEQGYRKIVVQAVHIAPAEEYLDLVSYIEALQFIRTVKFKNRPFHELILGRPALGALVSDQYSYSNDIRRLATVLAGDVDMAAQENRALVYLAHGNETISTSGYYLELAARLKELYKDVPVFFGAMEGFPSYKDVLQQLKSRGISKILLKPFMLTAGMHAIRDMAGSKDSWQTLFEQQEIDVKSVLTGLGEQDSFADIFVNHIADAASHAGMDLDAR